MTGIYSQPPVGAPGSFPTTPEYVPQQLTLQQIIQSPLFKQLMQSTSGQLPNTGFNGSQQGPGGNQSMNPYNCLSGLGNNEDEPPEDEES
jgi:hypothetical protein